MKSFKSLLKQFRVDGEGKFRLKDFDPGWQGSKKLDKQVRQQWAKEQLERDVTELSQAQELLYAADSRSLLLIFQAMDAAGKDGTIRHVMSGVNPQGCQVYSFKRPSVEELDHDFLWRYVKALPERGRIGIFNRSYYEDVLIVKVHPELIIPQHIPGGVSDPGFWKARYRDIRNLESHLVRNGTVILKFFLNVSKEEQKRRFLNRIDTPDKQWKFSEADIAERPYWEDYMKAYEAAIQETATEDAPWYVIPADKKWVARTLVAQVVVQTIQSLRLTYPEVTKEQTAVLASARQKLEAER